MYRLRTLRRSFIRAGSGGALRWRSALLLSSAAALLLFGLLSPDAGTCFLEYHLGLPCPLCGGTRALSALVRLDLAAAAISHAPLVLLVAGLFFSGIEGLFSDEAEKARWRRSAAFLGIWGWCFLLWYGIMVAVRLLAGG